MRKIFYATAIFKEEGSAAEAHENTDNYRPLDNVLKYPSQCLATLAFVVVLSFVAGTLLPALVAVHTRTFYYSDMEITAERLRPIAQYRARVCAVRAELFYLDGQIHKRLSESAAETLEALLRIRTVYQADLKRAEGSLIIQPFYLSRNMFVWTVSYICLSCLIFLLAPAASPPQFGRRTAAICLTLYAMYEFPVWLRNFALSNEGRKVYSYANQDVSTANFAVAEFNTFMLFVLLAIVWDQCLTHLAGAQISIRADVTSLAALGGRLRESFLHWQLSSILLGLSFLSFTFWFWSMVAAGDARYAIQAVTIHAIWAFSWIVLSLPVMAYWLRWQRLRQALLTERLDGNADHKTEIQMKFMEDMLPVRPLHALVSGVAAIVAFLTPLIGPLLRNAP